MENKKCLKPPTSYTIWNMASKTSCRNIDFTGLAYKKELAVTFLTRASQYPTRHAEPDQYLNFSVHFMMAFPLLRS
jgi:hypothetical protein